MSALRGQQHHRPRGSWVCFYSVGFAETALYAKFYLLKFYLLKHINILRIFLKVWVINVPTELYKDISIPCISSLSAAEEAPMCVDDDDDDDGYEHGCSEDEFDDEDFEMNAYEEVSASTR